MIKIIATLLTIFAFSTSHAKTVNVGIILGFTGPIESLTPDMAAGAELAFSEASNSGKLLNGSNINVIRADSTCIDSAAATSAAEGLVSQGVTAIMGADCSGVTGAILSNVAVPNRRLHYLVSLNYTDCLIFLGRLFLVLLFYLSHFFL